MRFSNLVRFKKIALLAVLVSISAHAQALTSPVVMPPPQVGSFDTAFDYAPGNRLVAFDGFTVYIEQSSGSATFTPIGTLPAEFQGATDPGFVLVSPDASFIVLSGGAGGAKFPDPKFNGTLFVMPITGGTATLVGTFPFIIAGTFLGPRKFVFGEGETFGTFTGSIELLDLNTLHRQSIVGPIPGDPGGIAFDALGNLYVGLGAGQDPARAGEIHRFTLGQIVSAIVNNTPLDFDAAGTLITSVLNAGSLGFDARGFLYVGGGNFNGGPTGFIAKVDPRTGRILAKFDPVDGSTTDGSQRFFALSFNRSKCVLGAQDLDAISPHTVYQVQVCHAD